MLNFNFVLLKTKHPISPSYVKWPFIQHWLEKQTPSMLQYLSVKQGSVTHVLTTLHIISLFLFEKRETLNCKIKIQITWASFLSLSISSSTEETIIPAFLLGGSVTSTISKSDLISTFKSSSLNFLMGFDFAFIMFGSVAYLGWFNLKSVLHHTQWKISHQSVYIWSYKHTETHIH